MQNGLGVVLAGGLGGFLYLQKQDKLKLEEQLSSELSSERSTVDELKEKVSTGIRGGVRMQVQESAVFAWLVCLELHVLVARLFTGSSGPQPLTTTLRNLWIQCSE